MIPPAFIHDLLARTDIVEIVGRVVQLKKAGATHKGLCPFHGEKTPSFTVSASRQTYHCFGCGVHGNAIGFLMEHSGLSFIDAVKDLAQQVGMQVPADDTSPQERERAARMKEKQATLSDVLAKACEHYRNQLKASPRAVDYLKRRGLSGEIAARFALGYAPDGWRGLAGVFARYDDPLLEESGLVIDRPAADPARDSSATPGSQDDPAAVTSKRYDRFRDRIMFPIRSVQGEVIGFGGRVLDQGEPKYLNSPETPVFVKGRELYGLHEARAALRKHGFALVVEGYMDVVALAQLGFPNAVATLGTACTAEHVQKLLRFTDSIVFSFDGDAAGRRAAQRALEASLPHASDTRSVRFLFLPPEHDPDSFVRERGAAAFEACIAQAVPLSRQLIAIASEGCDLDAAEGRARLLANARPLWEALPQGALKRQLLAELAECARDDLEQLRRQWGQPGAPSGGRGSAAHRVPPRRAGPVKREIANLLDRAIWLLLHRSDAWTALDGDAHDLLCVQPAPYAALFAAIERSIHEHGALAPGALLDELRQSVAGDALGSAALARIAAFHGPGTEGDTAVELSRVIAKLQLKAVDEELERLFESGVDSPDSQRRSRELMETRRRLKA
ncbi:MAG TPA: DNA primase [Burkholderiaceae bacterium]|nr:DNA primase [Burkholderiaceae bacterium]